MLSKTKALPGIPDPLWCYEAIPVGYGGFAPSTATSARSRTSSVGTSSTNRDCAAIREVIDYIIDKLRPEKKAKA
jgi:hypothetical protein